MNTPTNNNFVAKLDPSCVVVGEELEGELSVGRWFGGLLPALRFMEVNLSSGGKVSRVWRGRVKGINRTCAHCKSHAGYLLRPGDVVRGECLHMMPVSGLYLKVSHMSVGRLTFENH